jgi:hypothetical protein
VQRTTNVKDKDLEKVGILSFISSFIVDFCLISNDVVESEATAVPGTSEWRPDGV